MPSDEIEKVMLEQTESVVSRASLRGNNRFASLRGVQWRINLGILPSSSSSIDDLRRVTADSRRRYAGMRRRLLVDPHMPKVGNDSRDLVIDNPLSQNPDSTWGRFFRNAELEKTVDQDLSRLYPEHGSYFQAHGCQGMLRRILLLWCIRHPEFGYRQGMHELMAPLLYALHVDVEHLSEVRKQYEDHFTDKFDDLSFEESDITYNFDFKKFLDSMEEEIGSQGGQKNIQSLDDLDPEIQAIVLLSDAYGAEGELGIVLSEKFLEHDAYCMFDALMSGVHGAVAMADFFVHSPAGGSNTGLPPVIEASAALYHLLSIADSSLHSHLVELGVEPQYFALRWLRVLFGREFSLDDLLLVWDEIFAAENSKSEKVVEDDSSSSFGILNSPRGALILAIAVSMILHLRSSLLATETATSCLKRLLNFPKNVDLRKLIEKANSLKALALDSTVTSTVPYGGAYNHSKSMVVRGHSLSSDSISPSTPLNIVPDSYWEEKWRVLHKAEELQQGGLRNQNSTRKNRWSEKLKISLSRTESDPTPAKVKNGKKDGKLSVRRSLLEDLSKQLDSVKDKQKVDLQESSENDHRHLDVDRREGLVFKEDLQEGSSENDDHAVEVEVESQNGGANTEFGFPTKESCLSGNTGSEGNSSIFSDPTSPVRDADDHPENHSEKSSVASNISVDENDPQTSLENSPLPISNLPASSSPSESEHNKNSSPKSVAVGLKENKPLFGKFQWFWKFGRNSTGEESCEKDGGDFIDSTKLEHGENSKSSSSAAYSSADDSVSSSGSQGDVDQNVLNTVRNLGQSMIEHIQVIECVFQKDRGQAGSTENFSKNGLVGKGQVTAITALKELRKISNLLSQM